jgi:hypothetical protein
VPGLALAGQADARAVLDAGRDVDLERLLAPHAALARAVLARLVDDLARAVAGVAGALDGEEALLRPQPAVAFAGRALVRLGAGLGAGAAADLAGDRARHPDRGFGAAIGLLERDLEIEAQILAAHVAAARQGARRRVRRLNISSKISPNTEPKSKPWPFMPPGPPGP